MTTPSPRASLRILGTGVYLPRRVVASEVFDRRFGKRTGWAERRFGVARRHVAEPDETSSFMAARAAEAALLVAGLAPQDVECTISACSVMEQAIPCLGSLVQRELGLGESGRVAFDVNATCLSFLAALDLVACALAVGRYRRVLVVSSEIASAGVDPEDPTTAPLFGDGAAAVVLGAADAGQDSALLACELATYGVGHDLCRVRAGGTRLRAADDPEAHVRGSRFEMDGPGLYRLSARHFPRHFERAVAAAGVAREQLACVIPHQASGRAIEHMIGTLGLPLDRVVHILANRGNQVAASLPSALHEAIASGALRRGQLCTLLGTGAGLSLGTAILRY